MIEIKSITKRYDSKLVLDNLSLKIKENSINIVSGPSGCGKTTLFNIISGIDLNFSGSISGVPSEVAYLFQEDRLLPYFTVLENVMFTLPESIDSESRMKLAKKYLKLLKLNDDLSSFPHELSGGMKRRVAIARALAFPCELLLMDEPFNGLNPELKDEVVSTVFKSMESMQKTVIIITHDQIPFRHRSDINMIKLA